MAPVNENDWEDVDGDWEDSTAPAISPVQQEVNKTVGPLESFGLHATNPLGLGKSLMGVGEGLYEAATAGPQTAYGPQQTVKDYLLSKYQRGHETGMQAYDAATKANPVASGVGDVGNAIATSLLPPLKAAGMAGRVGVGMGLGELQGLGSSDADITKAGGVQQLGRDVGSGAIVGGVTGALPGRAVLGGLAGGYMARKNLEKGELGTAAAKIGGGMALGQMAPALVRGIPKAYGHLLGVNPEAVTDYLARSKEINSSPGRAEVMNRVDEVVNGLRDQLDNAKLALERAHGDARATAREAVSRAEDRLREAENQKLLAVTQGIEEGTDQLQKEVVQGSKDATHTIKDSVISGDAKPGGIPRRHLLSSLQSAMTGLKPFGNKSAPTPDAVGSASELQNWYTWLQENAPEEISYEQAKPIIQALDRATEDYYKRLPGGFNSPELRALQGLRRNIDEQLKLGVEPYKQAMVPVAEDTRLLGEVRDQLGAGAPLMGRLRRIDTPEQSGALDVLGRFGQRVKRDFRGDLATPNESAALERAQQQALPSAIESRMAASPEQAAVGSAQQGYDPVSNLYRNSEPWMKRMLQGKQNAVENSLQDQQMMRNVSEHLPELPQQMQNLKTLNAFTGERTNGSRNTLLGGLLGGGAAMMTHNYGLGSMGMMAGGMAGHVVDKYGPKMAKAGLDRYIPARDWAQTTMAKIQANPQVQQYVAPLLQSAGDPARFAAKYYLLMKSVPEFRQAMEPEMHR